LQEVKVFSLKLDILYGFFQPKQHPLFKVIPYIFIGVKTVLLLVGVSSF